MKLFGGGGLICLKYSTVLVTSRSSVYEAYLRRNARVDACWDRTDFDAAIRSFAYLTPNDG